MTVLKNYDKSQLFFLLTLLKPVIQAIFMIIP